MAHQTLHYEAAGLWEHTSQQNLTNSSMLFAAKQLHLESFRAAFPKLLLWGATFQNAKLVTTQTFHVKELDDAYGS